MASNSKYTFILPTVSLCFVIASFTPVTCTVMTSSVSVPGGRGVPFDVSSLTVNVASSVRLRSCTRRLSGDAANAGTSTSASSDVKSSPGDTEYDIPCGIASAAPNLRMRNVVDMFAAKRPAPMATASSASR